MEEIPIRNALSSSTFGHKRIVSALPPKVHFCVPRNENSALNGVYKHFYEICALWKVLSIRWWKGLTRGGLSFKSGCCSLPYAKAQEPIDKGICIANRPICIRKGVILVQLCSNGGSVIKVLYHKKLCFDQFLLVQVLYKH